MRELNTAELAFVSGGEDLLYLPPDGNWDDGSTNPPSDEGDPGEVYEGVVFFASHAIEHVAGAL